jgi:hypothetical protein
MDADGLVEGVVAIELDDVIDSDRDRVMELLSEALADSNAIEDIEYELVGNDGDMLHVLVRGDASSLVEDEDEEEDEDEQEGEY